MGSVTIPSPPPPQLPSLSCRPTHPPLATTRRREAGSSSGSRPPLSRKTGVYGLGGGGRGRPHREGRRRRGGGDRTRNASWRRERGGAGSWWWRCREGKEGKERRAGPAVSIELRYHQGGRPWRRRRWRLALHHTNKLESSIEKKKQEKSRRPHSILHHTHPHRISAPHPTRPAIPSCDSRLPPPPTPPPLTSGVPLQLRLPPLVPPPPPAAHSVGSPISTSGWKSILSARRLALCVAGR